MKMLTDADNTLKPAKIIYNKDGIPTNVPDMDSDLTLLLWAEIDAPIQADELEPFIGYWIQDCNKWVLYSEWGEEMSSQLIPTHYMIVPVVKKPTSQGAKK